MNEGRTKSLVKELAPSQRPIGGPPAPKPTVEGMNAEAEAARAVLRDLVTRQERGESLVPSVELAKLDLSGRLTQCRSCGALIVFLSSVRSGGYVPVDARTVQANQYRFTPPDHVAR